MGSLFDPIKTQVLAIIKKYKGSGSPKGFAAVFTFLFSVTAEFVELVETSWAVVKTAKLETVVEAVKFAYAEVNPDLPWIPEPFETKLETWLLDQAVPAFVNWIVAKYNAKGIFIKK